MADEALVIAVIGFCICYIVFLMIVLAVGILSRLDPVIYYGFLFYLQSFCTVLVMTSMGCLLIRIRCIRVVGMRWEWD